MVQKRCYFQKFLNSVHFLFLLPGFCLNCSFYKKCFDLWIILYTFSTFQPLKMYSSFKWVKSYLSWSPEFRNLRDVDDQICVLKKQKQNPCFPNLYITVTFCVIVLSKIGCKRDNKYSSLLYVWLICFCMTLLYLINICTYSLVKLFEVLMACLTLLSLSCALGCNQPLT